MKNQMIFLVLVAASLLNGCFSKSKKDADIKAQDISTVSEKSEAMSSSETVGVNKDENVVVQKKVKLIDHLKEVSYQVRKKQDELYGSRRFNTRGLYGRYEKCMAANQKKTKVARNMVLKETEFGQLEADKFGFDEKGEMVALEEQKLRDKIRDLEGMRNRLFSQEEELLSAISECENQQASATAK